jgi:hypothetical protein
MGIGGGGGMPSIGNGSGGLPGMGMGGGGAFGFLSGGNTPQDRGFGIADPGEFVGYQSSPGMMPGNTTGMESLDISGPGAAELYYGNNQDAYQTPGQTEQWWNRNQGQFGTPGMGEGYAAGAVSRYGDGRNPQGSNYQQETYRQFQGDRPDISADAGLDPYYEHARKMGSEALNNQMAARGGFNSSAATDQLGNLYSSLGADQANREAQYHLQRLGEQRAWDQLGGQLAGGLDANSLAQSQNQLEWTTALGNIANMGQQDWLQRMNAGMGGAGNADTAMLNRLNAGMGAANTAQQNQMGRAQQLFASQLGLGNALSGIAGQDYNSLLGQDQSLMDASMAAEMGLGSEALNQDYRTQQRIKDDASWAEDMMSGGGGGGGKGGGGGGLLGGMLGGII